MDCFFLPFFLGFSGKNKCCYCMFLTWTGFSSLMEHYAHSWRLLLQSFSSMNYETPTFYCV